MVCGVAAPRESDVESLSVVASSTRSSQTRLAVVATTADAPTIAAVAATLSNQAPVVVVLGQEGSGLSASAMDACTHRARIPMAAGVDSLNVATAGAIALYALTPR